MTFSEAVAANESGVFFVDGTWIGLSTGNEVCSSEDRAECIETLDRFELEADLMCGV